jgi:hypothetical protein
MNAMDDAGNGLRGVRATPSPRLLERLRELYSLDTIGTFPATDEVMDEVRDLGGPRTSTCT